MKIENQVLAVLSSAIVSGNKVSLTGQLDRKLYEKTNKVLEAAGGKWSRKDKAHVFDCDAQDRIEQIILTGDIELPKSARNEFEYFPTPDDVLLRLIEEAKITDGMLVLEPSAGRGAIAKAVHSSASGVMIDMYELMPENNSYLHDLNLSMCGIGEPTDFLSVEPKQIYDRVVMNPPFSKRADIKHVKHALNFLKKGGLLVSVMSAGILFREDRLAVDFRSMVNERGGSIDKLPDGSFKSSGTMVGTVIVVIPA